MGTVISCNSTTTDIDDASEPLRHPQSSSLPPSDHQIELFRCGCCRMEVPDDIDIDSQDERIMKPHEMKAINTIASYRSKLLHGTGGGSGSGDGDGDDFEFGLNMVHMSSPPFLGASYWIPMDDGDDDDDKEEEEKENGDEVTTFLNILPDTVGILSDVENNVVDQSVMTGESMHSSIESSVHTSCNTASTRELGSPCHATQEQSRLMSQSQSSPNFIIQNTVRNISTPCITPRPGSQPISQEPPLETSSVSTASTVSSALSIVAAKVETARRLFGDRDDLLYNRDMSPTLDPVLIACDDVSDIEEGHCHNMLNITTPMRTTTFQTSMPISGSPCTTISQHSSRSDNSIILRNGVLLKRPLISPETTPITISSTSTTTTTTTTKQKRRQIYSNNTTYSTNTSLDSTSLVNDTIDVPDGILRREDDVTTKHVNTLPSFRAEFPICLRVTESYAGYSSGNLNSAGEDTNNHNDIIGRTTDMNRANINDSLNASGISLLSHEEEQDFFSYDPYFSSGQYLIEQKETGGGYGNELRVTMGEQYMTLQDKDDTVWAVTRSRHSICPSTVIYSPKERYPSQIPSSHRPISQQRGGGYNCNNYGINDGDGAVELYPWALVKKGGNTMDHDVAIHLVAEPNEVGVAGGLTQGNRQPLIGGLFDSRVSFRSRHGFDEKEAHSYTTMYRVEFEEGSNVEGTNDETMKEREIPCCIIIRDPINRDVVDVTIAPGIDPLLIICYLAVHAKMDVEPKLCEQ